MNLSDQEKAEMLECLEVVLPKAGQKVGTTGKHVQQKESSVQYKGVYYTYRKDEYELPKSHGGGVGYIRVISKVGKDDLIYGLTCDCKPDGKDVMSWFVFDPDAVL